MVKQENMGEVYKCFRPALESIYNEELRARADDIVSEFCGAYNDGAAESDEKLRGYSRLLSSLTDIASSKFSEDLVGSGLTSVAINLFTSVKTEAVKKPRLCLPTKLLP